MRLGTSFEKRVSKEVSLLATGEGFFYDGGKEDPVAPLCTKPASKWSARACQYHRRIWSIFKHGVVGSLHRACAKYLPLYVAENLV
jgi:hypothetical protein